MPFEVLGKRIEQYHLSWLEDVVAHDDYQGAAQVAAAIRISRSGVMAIGL